MSLKALVADDSILFRRVLADTLNSLPGVEVVGAVGNGRLALQKVRELKPDPDRKRRRAQALIGAKQEVATYGFRWPAEFHARIVEIATQYHVSIGAVTNRLLSFAVDEWCAGRLTIDTQPVASNDVVRWETTK